MASEYRSYTLAMAENTQDEELYDLHLTRQPDLEKLLAYMEGGRWDLLFLAADSGWVTATFRRDNSG